MLETLSLPWWAAGYLMVLLSFSVAGLINDLKHHPAGCVGSVMSLAFVFVFVIGYFHAPLAQHFGLLMLPMVVIGVAWEFTQAVQDTGRAEEELEKENDLDENEKTFLLNMATALNALLIVPGYVFGLKLCFDIIFGG